MDVTMNGLWVGILVAGAILIYQVVRMVLEVRRETVVWLPLAALAVALGYINPVASLGLLVSADALLAYAWLHHRGPFTPR